MDLMTDSEVERLLISAAFPQLLDHDNGLLREKCKQVAGQLGRFPLGLHLAGLTVKNGPKIVLCEDACQALDTYMGDFEAHGKQLMSNSKFRGSSRYQQTVWNAWEATFEIMRKWEEGTLSLRIFKLLCHLDPPVDLHAILEQAWRGQSIGTQRLKRLPDWICDILATKKNGGTGVWDSYPFRNSMGLLLRYGLITVDPGSQYKGQISIHSLLRWRARHDPEYVESEYV